MAFTTVTGSNGVTSLVGTTGVDIATIVTLESNVFIGGNTANDVVTTALGTGGNNLTNYDVRMGGGDDTFTLGNTLLNSIISLDGTTLANDGNDTFNGGGNLIVNSEVVGRGGNDNLQNLALNGSTVNGNTGDDTISVAASSASFVYGGQGTDTITTTAASSAVFINGNKGSDFITLGAFAFAAGSVYGGNGNDTITAAAVTVAAPTNAGVLLSGDIGDDTITGSTGIDTINGGDGSDVINGGTGADLIDGGSGDDNITGAAGADVLTGGAGSDAFAGYATASVAGVAAGSNTGFDTITDFAASTNPVATANGDRFAVGAALAAVTTTTVIAAGSVGSASGLDLNAILTTAFAGLNAAGGAAQYGTITITAGATNAGIAGNYVVINSDGLAGFGATDSVIKVNTLSNITTANIANVFTAA